MRKLTKIIIAIVLLFILLFISSGYFLKQECYGSQCLPPEMKVVYDIVKNCGLEYQEEKLGKDYWKAPYETERDNGGDCEDLTFWLLHKLTSMGYDCWAQAGTDESGHNIHMWVRIKLKNGEYWDVDMTIRYLIRAFFPVPLNRRELERMQEVIKKQEKYEKGE